MSIDRTQFFELQDDYGPGYDTVYTIGSDWSKNKIQTVILDPIDAEFTDWASVSYSAALYSVVSGTGTWTVDAGNQSCYRWRKFNKCLQISVILNATSITGTVSLIGIGLPSGFVTSSNNPLQCTLCNIINAGTGTWGYWYCNPSFTQLYVGLMNQNFALATNNTYIYLNATLEIQ